ncbi:DUF6406 domain-containing protein [Actinoallomurus iriomotensis]|nr:DUF6406 domain-containing protein [Actinoallomurus iriomotensis]
MTDHLPDTIELRETVPDRLGRGVVIGGDTYVDDEGRLEIRLAIKDDAGERSIRRHEGDVFEFAGADWRVARISGPAMGGRSHIATLSRVE